jgi:hypothetical protein
MSAQADFGPDPRLRQHGRQCQARARPSWPGPLPRPSSTPVPDEVAWKNGPGGVQGRKASGFERLPLEAATSPSFGLSAMKRRLGRSRLPSP